MSFKKNYPAWSEKTSKKKAFYDYLLPIRKEIKKNCLEVEVSRANLASKYPDLPQEAIFKFTDTLEVLVSLTEEEKNTLEEYFLNKVDHIAYISKMKFPRKKKLAEDYYAKLKQEAQWKENIEKSLEDYQENCEKVECTKLLLKKIIEDPKNSIEVKTVTAKRISQKRNFTKCLKCIYSCHENCDHKRKEKCMAMCKKGMCTVCDHHKCHWKLHKDTSHIFKIRVVTKKKYLKTLEREYKCNAESSLSQHLLNELKETIIIILGSLDSAGANLAMLEKVTKSTISNETSDYVKIIIKFEEREERPGWKNRIENLKIIQEEIEKDLGTQEPTKKSMRLKETFYSKIYEEAGKELGGAIENLIKIEIQKESEKQNLKKRA